MNINERLEANAIIDEIMKEGETTFSREKAERLIQILPLRQESVFSITNKQGSSNSKTSGYSPGVGFVEIEDKNKNKEEKTWLGNEPLRIGGYKLFHQKGSITIRLMWDDTIIKSVDARLIYNKVTKSAKALCLSDIKTLNLYFIVFNIRIYKLWKRPV